MRNGLWFKNKRVTWSEAKEAGWQVRVVEWDEGNGTRGSRSQEVPEGCMWVGDDWYWWKE